jgi:hypothetical protein
VSAAESFERNRFCLDSDCAGVAEPEEDSAEGGMLRYFTCSRCGMEFGYELVRDEDAAGNCSMGIPESVRRVASVPPEGKGVFIGQIGRRPE